MRLRILSLIVCLLAMTASPYMIGAAAEEGKTEFLRNLLRKPQATFEDAIHATARYKGYNNPTDLDAEIVFLGKQGIQFPSDIKKTLNDALDKGSATYLLMKTLGVKGGVMYRLFPGSQRYAMREAVDLGFLSADSVVSEKMTGADLLGLLVKVVEYTNKKVKTD